MGIPTKLPHVRRLAASLAVTVAAAARGAAAQDAAQGTAAQFQGVERWDGVATLDVYINLMGGSRHRSKTVKFTLDKHRASGTTETWLGKVKGGTKDEDSAGPFSGDVVGGRNSDVTLTLDMNGDVARLDVHTDASKHKMTMKAMGVKLQSMDVAQPARDTRTELPIPEDAENLVFGSDAENGGVRVKNVVTLTPNEIPLRAVLTAGFAVRGATAMLDGSRSKGRIRTFKWTLTPQGASGARAATFETRERKVQLVLLEDVKVDLEVSNGRKRSSTSDLAKVRPRQWATKFVQRRDDGVLEGEQLVSEDAVPLAVNRFGQDACAVEGPGSGHGLHTTNPVTWKNDPDAGYTVQAVDDPDRPFDGYWYVKEQALIVERRALFNPDLMAGSPLFAKNAAKGTSEPFGRLVASTRAHEYKHGELMRLALVRDDPAKRIERLVEPGEDELATRADMEIRETETRLQEGEFHELEVRAAMRKQFSKGGTVWVRDGRGGFAPWAIASFADKAK